jgi:hypothetical protein
VAIASTLLLVGCAHSIPVPPDDVTRLAHFHETGVTVVHDGDRAVRVTGENDPRLTLRLTRSCSLWQVIFNRCDRVVSSPLSAVRANRAGLELAVKTSAVFGGVRSVRVEQREIESARLSIDGYVHRDWHPSGGIGIAAAGPLGLAGYVGQYLPAPWVAIEAGMLPASHVFAGYVGARVRPIAMGRLRPFLGAFANHSAWLDDGSDETTSMSSVGPRVGVDIAILLRRGLITLELDLAHPIDGDSAFFTDLQGAWIPWGGGTISYMF